MTDQERQPPQSPASVPPPSDQPAQRPWRTEGVPSGQAAEATFRLDAMAAVAGRLPDSVRAVHLSGSDERAGGRLVHRIQGPSRDARTSRRYLHGATPFKARSKRPLPCPTSRIARMTSSPPSGRHSRPMICWLNWPAGEAIVRAKPLVQERGVFTNLLFSIGPMLLLFGFYFWMFRRQQSAMGGGILGGRARKPVDPETVRVTFDDVAGIDEVEAEINEVVDFLRNPAKYRRLGARAPKGVLLTGAPGTGKTLLARATAGEAKVPFFSASASEFIEMIVGVGASRVRELFAEARKVAPGDHLHRRDRHDRPDARRECAWAVTTSVNRR